MRITSGKFKGRNLKVPKGVRPTFTKLKLSFFNICAPYIENAVFLDLFGGAGGIAFEALSRGASHVTIVERNKKAIETIRENAHLLAVESEMDILSLDVYEALKRLHSKGSKFDIIFADPPYGTKLNSLSDQVLRCIDSYPLLKKGGELFLEDAVEAYDESYQPVSLILKSKRKMGPALLREYIYE